MSTDMGKMKTLYLLNMIYCHHLVSKGSDCTYIPTSAYTPRLALGETEVVRWMTGI